jgi:ligand-binding SRPBCC domain-containing protein
MRYTYNSEQFLPYPVELVFAFFANPDNLPRLMPPWQKARIEEAAIVPPPPRPPNTPRFAAIAAGAGTKLTISFRPFPFAPLRVPWEADITDFAWNDRFCDDQVRGPFAYWHHCHNVSAATRPDATGALIQGTLLRDEVTYEPPLGPLGEFANRLILRRQLESTFNYRRKRTLELLPPAV